MNEPRITPYPNTDLVCWECDPEKWDGSWVFAPITASYCGQCKKYMDPLDQPRKPLPVWENMPGSMPHPPSYYLKEMGYADPEELRGLRVEEDFRELLQKELDKKNQEIESLLGIIRRLEKSNQELGEQLHRLGPGEGWNKNV